MNPTKDVEIQARRLFTPPFSYRAGYIYDSVGDMVADEAGHVLRVRGWGRLGGMQDGAQLQDACGERIARLLTKHWNDGV